MALWGRVFARLKGSGVSVGYNSFGPNGFLYGCFVAQFFVVWVLRP